MLVVGLGIWFFEVRGDSGPGLSNDGYGIVALPAGTNPTGEAPAAREGRAAPDFRLPTLDGGVVTLDGLRGKYVLINFWASWCGPCRGETPDLQALAERTGGDGLVVVGVNQQEPAEVAGSFAREFGVTYPVALDRDGGVSSGYNVAHGLPVSVLVDPRGVVRAIFVGRIPSATLATFERDQLAATP